MVQWIDAYGSMAQWIDDKADIYTKPSNHRAMNHRTIMPSMYQATELVIPALVHQTIDPSNHRTIRPKSDVTSDISIQNTVPAKWRHHWLGIWFTSHYEMVSLRLTVSRKTAKNLGVRRKTWRILTVNRKILATKKTGPKIACEGFCDLPFMCFGAQNVS